MSEELSQFKPLDPGRIHVDDPLEAQYWCMQLRCNEASLRDAVSKVGDHVTAVRDHLASRE